MKNTARCLRVFSFLLFAATSSILFTACQNSTPGAASVPVVPNFNAFSAFATIGAGTMLNPTNVLYFGRDFWVMDQQNKALEKWSTSGNLLKSVTTFNGGQTFNGIWGLGINYRGGDVYVPDYNNGIVNVFDAKGNYLTTFGSAELSGNIPQGVAFDPMGRKVYVLASDSTIGYQSKIYVYNIMGNCSHPTFAYTGNFGQNGVPAQSLGTYGEGMSSDCAGNIWAADYGTQRVLEYDSSGTYVRTLTSVDFATPSYVMVTCSGYIFVSDDTNNFIVVFDSSGTQIGKFGTGQLNTPEGTTVYRDAVYVADYNNSRVVAFH